MEDAALLTSCGSRTRSLDFHVLGPLLRLGVDLVLLAGAVLAGGAGSEEDLAAGPSLHWILFALAGIYLFGGYRTVNLRRPESEFEGVVKGLAGAALALTLAQAMGGDGLSAGGVFWLALALPAVVAGRGLVRLFCAQCWRRERGTERVVVFGSAGTLARIRENALLRRDAGFEMAALIAAGSAESGWQAAIERASPGAVFVDMELWPAGERCLERILEFCLERRIAVELLYPAIRGVGKQLSVDPALGAIRCTARPAWSTGLQRACKWLTDRILGLVGTVATMVLAPLVWGLIALEDPGPLFHRREYVGCDGQIHYYRKFRTMLRNADEILRRDPALLRQFHENHKLRRDPRVLRVGAVLRRFSIDEFPQFFKVLTGELSLVGPRVISGAERERYGEHLAKRLTVKPGLTGYWQTMGRQTTSYQERILMDMYYIDHWSIWMDLTIILRTFAKVLLQEGAY